MASITAITGANIPIYKVLKKGADGLEYRVRGREASGVVQELVRRLSHEDTSKETVFFKKMFSLFKHNPQAASTRVLRNGLEERHMIFGDDVNLVNISRRDCYVKKVIDEDSFFDIIASLIRPLNKKIRLPKFPNDSVGEQVGLVLHANQHRIKGKGLKYDFGIDVISLDGQRIHGVLPSDIVEIAQKQPKVNIKTQAEQVANKKEEALQGNFFNMLLKKDTNISTKEATNSTYGWEQIGKKKAKRR